MAGEEEREGVRLTSLDKPLGDDLDVTKGDLVDYLDAVADRMVPLLAGRPLSVKRVRPGQAPFMQRNVSKARRTGADGPVWSEGSHREIAQVLCDDRRTLLWLANQRASSSTSPSSGPGTPRPTGLVLDLDPPEERTSRSSSAPRGSSSGGLEDGGAVRSGEDQRLEGRARRRPGAGSAVRGRRRRHPRSPPAPNASTPSWRRRRTSRRTGTGGSSSIRPGRVRTRSWPPTAPHPARTSGVRAGRLGRPGRRLARGLHVTSAADRFPTEWADVLLSRRSCRPTWWRRATRSPSPGWRRCTRASAGSGPPSARRPED